MSESIRPEPPEARKISAKKKLQHLGASALLLGSTIAGTATMAQRAGENAVKKDMGMEYAGDIAKNQELSLLPDHTYVVQDGDSVEGIYHKLNYAEKGFSLEAFMAEVEKRNPGITGSEERSDWTIYPAQGLNIPKLAE
jgi:hypothetical protein